MKRKRTNQRGQAFVEYALLISFVSIIVVSEVVAMQYGFLWIAQQLTKRV